MKFLLLCVNQFDHIVILVVNLKERKIMENIKGNMMGILGMFFINENNFCVVFRQKFNIFKIQKCVEKDTNRMFDTISLIKNVKYEKDKIFDFFIFNKKFMVMCLVNEKNLNSFTFYHLDNEQLINKGYDMEIPDNIIANKIISNKENNQEPMNKEHRSFSIFNIFKKKKDNSQTKEDLSFYENTEKVIKNFSSIQVFFENLYSKLYLIILNLNEGKITLFRIINLSYFELKYEIKLVIEDEKTKGTLQFVDNLILFHNFNKQITSIYDVKIKNKEKSLLLTFPSPILPITIYSNILSINGPIIKMLNENVKIVFILLYFDSETFYLNYPNDYEAVFHLLHRKNSNIVLVDILKKIILDMNKIKVLITLFSLIADQFYKNLAIKKKKKKHHLKSVQEKTPGNFELPSLTSHIKKKNCLKQRDIIGLIFYELNNHMDNKIYMIIIMIFFYLTVSSKKLLIHNSFHEELFNYIKQLRKIDEILIFFQFHSIPDSIQLSNYFVNKEPNSIFFQLGIDMMKRLNKYDEVALTLLKYGKIKEGIMFISKYKKEIHISLIKNKTKDILLTNMKQRDNNIRKLLISFIESSYNI